jgi:hypothetical protein
VPNAQVSTAKSSRRQRNGELPSTVLLRLASGQLPRILHSALSASLEREMSRGYDSATVTSI